MPVEKQKEACFCARISVNYMFIKQARFQAGALIKHEAKSTTSQSVVCQWMEAAQMGAAK